MWTYEYDENIKFDSNQLKIASDWFVNRLEEFYDGGIDEIYIDIDKIIIDYSWDDYCRGCHMGTIREHYAIPNSIFFSDQSLNDWRENEDNLRRQKKENERKKKEKLEQRQEEREEKNEYLRLKTKYEN